MTDRKFFRAFNDAYGRRVYQCRHCGQLFEPLDKTGRENTIGMNAHLSKHVRAIVEGRRSMTPKVSTR